MGLAKEVVELCRLKGVFQQSPKSEFSIAEALGHASQRIWQTLTFKVGDQDHCLSQIKLDAGSSHYLESLVLGEPLVSWSREQQQEVEKTVEDVVLPSFRSLFSTPASIETEPLRGALEWAFEAAIDHDPIFAFIKSCIAIEAALGEDAKEDSITERLSDRCAFHLGKNPSGRKLIRAHVREIYRLRSVLVHGVKRKLDKDEREVADWAVLYLRGVLRKELEAVTQTSS